MRRTKIIATLGPSSANPTVLDALITAGTDIFRLNFSHGTHASHADVFARIRDAASRAGRHIAILQDLSGPKIRTGLLEGGRPIDFTPGDELRIVTGTGIGGPGRVFTPYGPLAECARVSDRLLLDDGKIELQVIGCGHGELLTRIVSGHQLGEHKGINAPGVQLPACAITAKDEDDLRFGLGLGVDCVALSFVQTADDVQTARRIVAASGADVPLIAKIERPQALDHLDAILHAADGVMVARGDLGLECPLEHVPRVQKTIVARARTLGRPVIVATQVLESMRVQPRPTRAEVSDAATAVDQGVDAIMLAGETAAGAYPVAAVETLAAIVRDAETGSSLAVRLVADDESGAPDRFDVLRAVHGRAMCEAAVTLAATGHAAAIVAVTAHGKTAQLLSSLRPPAPVVAVTPSARVARRLSLNWGVQALVSDLDDLRALEAPVRSAAGLAPGAVVVFVNVNPDLARADKNFLTVQSLIRGVADA